MKAIDDKLDTGIDTAMETQLLDMARRAIVEAHRKLKDGLSLDAGESARMHARCSLPWKSCGTAIRTWRNGCCKGAPARSRPR